MAKSSCAHAHLTTQAATAAPVNSSSTPGERACQLAASAEVVVGAYASNRGTDLAEGLYRLACEGAAVVNAAITSGSLEMVEDADARYCMWTAIFTAVAKQEDYDLLYAGVSLLAQTKVMLEGEVTRLMQARIQAVQS